MKKVMNIIGILVALILAISVVTLFVNVLKINIIPSKYMMGIIIVGIILFIFCILLIIPKVHWIIKMILSIISILVVIGCIFGVLKLRETVSFFENIEASQYEVEQYYVIVLKDSSYQKIDDIKDKMVGVYPTSLETYERAISFFDEKVSTSKKEYDDLLKMATDLLNNKVDALLISDAHKIAIEEAYDTFLNKIRILDTIEVKTELDNLVKDTTVTEKPFSVYISGIDTYGPISTRSRSDVNIIMTINPVTHEIVLTSTPRDYYVQLHGTTGLKDKLTHAGVYGINMSIQTLEDLLDMDINYYVRVNFNTLIDVVDVIGGITIDSDQSFTAYTNRNCSFQKGMNALNGTCALAFARERYAYATGDRHRGQNQQQVITKIIDKLTSSKTLISKYSEILKSLEGSFQTNMETEKIYSLIKMQLDDMPKWNVNSISLDGSGSMTYTHSYPKQKLYVMVPNQNTITRAKKVIDGIVEGKTYQEIEK